MKKKFELTTNTKMWFGKKLFQVKALVSFGNVQAGDLGGYVEKEENLSCDGNAWVYGNALVCGDAEVCGNALVYDDADYLVIGPIGSRNAYTTFYRRKDGMTMVVCGCFHGTIDEFAVKVAETHGDTLHGQAYRAAIQLAKIRVRTEPAKE